MARIGSGGCWYLARNDENGRARQWLVVAHLFSAGSGWTAGGVGKHDSDQPPAPNIGEDMRTDPHSGITIIGDAVSGSDGDEEPLLEVMLGVTDRSSSSDELAAHITDWDSRYELSRMRANIVRPLRIGGDTRVLDVGAGTGALSRYLGELGAEVVALEENIDRARIAHARCVELPNVQVVCGRPADLRDDEGFDVVILCGVLALAPEMYGGTGGPQELLEVLARLTRPTGALVVAIENQLGVGQLVGHAERHHGRPWVGVEGYGDPRSARTWTRSELSDLLSVAGCTEQRWLYAFPDYRLAATVVADRAYDESDAARFLDQLLGSPARVDEAPPAVHADARRVHRSCLAAGIGRDVASSFVVVASIAGDAADRLLDPDVLAWRFGNERRRIWLRETVVRASDDGRTASQERLVVDGGRPEVGWLSQTITASRPYRIGPTLDQDFRRAAAARDEDSMRAVLQRWREHLRDQERPRDECRAVHPYLGTDADRMLPPSWVDVSLDNFVDEDGELYFIDDEWVVPEGVASELAVARALWWLARGMIANGVDHPWSVMLTVDELAVTLGRLIGESIDADRLETIRSAEAELLVLVGGADPASVLDDLAVEAQTSSYQLGLSRRHFVGALSRADREIQALVAAREHTITEQERREEEERYTELIDELAEQLDDARRLYHEELQRSEELVGTLERIRGRFPLQIYFRLRGLLGGGG